MAGLGSFIDGFVGGYDTRQRWDDRKRQRKLDEEDRVYTEEQRQNARSDRAYTLEERQRQRAREDQAEAEKAAERQAYSDAYTASKEGEKPAGAAPQGRSLLDAGAGGNTPLSFGSNVPMMADPSSAAMMPATAPVVDGRMGRGLPPGTVTPTYPAQPASSIPGPDLPPPSVLAAQTQDYLANLPPSAPAAPVAQPAIEPTTDPNLKALSADFQGAVAKGGRSLVTPGDTAASVAAVLPTPNASPAAAAAASDPAAAQTNPAASPAVQIAAATAPQGAAPKARLAFGIDAPLTVTPKQAAAATDSFMQNYLEVGVPKMVDFYMKTGQVEKAQAFMDWAKEGKNQESMRIWAEGVHAAAIGDETKMLDSFAKYYNRFDNGEELVRAKSGITRDGNGNMTGATLTFKDSRTGVEHTQTMNGTEDLLQAGIMSLSPEKMFEMMQNQQDAANKVAASSVEFQQAIALASAKAGMKGDFKSYPERLTAYVTETMKNSLGSLTVDQAIAQAEARIAAEDASVAGRGTADLPDDYSE